MCEERIRTNVVTRIVLAAFSLFRSHDPGISTVSNADVQSVDRVCRTLL